MASISYRPDVDGLRCVAVLAIVMFHAAPTKLPGGFVGVDIFFVISGFLITKIIVADIAQDRFSLARFYGRRIRRIFPALILMLIACLVVGWILLQADDYARLGRHVAGGAAFVSNLVFWSENNYFDVAAELKPLLHTWSLGVEEQFYILWPLLIYGVSRMRVSISAVLAGLTILSFLLCLHLSEQDPTQAFYSPLSRVWQLSIGGVLATIPLSDREGRARDLMSIAALGMIVASSWTISPATILPAPWAALPVTGTALLIWTGPAAAANRLLSTKPAVWIGLISYPLYLWHWPLLSFVRLENNMMDPDRSVRVALVALAFLLAGLTYKFVERPLKSKRPLLLAAGMFVLLLSGLAVNFFHGFPGRAVNRDERKTFIALHQKMRFDPERQRIKCNFQEWRTLRRRERIDDNCTRPGMKGTYFLWGDSHAKALWLGLRKLAPAGIGVAGVTTSGCRPQLPGDTKWEINLRGAALASCRHSNLYALDAIKRLKPEILVLAQSDNHERTDWNKIALHALRLGARRVVLVGPTPQWLPSLPAVIVKYHWPLRKEYVSINLDREILRTEAILKHDYGRSNRLVYVSLIADLCDKRGCRAKVGNSLTVYDYGHLTSEGSYYAAGLILSQSRRGSRPSSLTTGQTEAGNRP